MNLYSEWTVAPAPDEVEVQAMMEQLGLSRLTAALLATRGYTAPAAAQAFLDAALSTLHDPHQLPDLSKAVVRIGQALAERERIGVYGDYDVDGQTSTALLVRGLRALGSDPRWYIPERVAEGYGLHRRAIEQLAEEGVTLLITVDCGSGAVEEVLRAKELGMDIIITDHHEPGPLIPPATAFVNPKRPDAVYPFRELAGVGIAFKLMLALWRSKGRVGLPPHSLELAAMGTVADVTPLVDENRVLVREGLARINAGAMPALTALADVSGVKAGEVGATQIAFGLAPRLNAAGRVGHAALGVQLLLEDDYERARERAEQLDRENTHRRHIEADILQQAVAAVEGGDMLSDWVLVVAGDGWHPGVIGIVASRLVDRYARPAFVIGLEGAVGTGSGRSIDAFDLYEALQTCAPLLERYGGHQMAAGITITRDKVDAFRRALNARAAQVLTPADLVPRTRVDLKVSLKELDVGTAREILRLAPFGAGNPTPVFAVEDAVIIGVRTVGQQRDHLKLILKDRHGEGLYEAMAFGGGGLAEALLPGSQVHAAFRLRLGQWRGEEQLTLVLQALQSPLAVAQRRAALHEPPQIVGETPVSQVRGRPVPVADRRDKAAGHPLARAAYVAPLADTGARIVAVLGPGDDGSGLAGSLGHTLSAPVQLVDRVPFLPQHRAYVVSPELPPAADGADGVEAEPSPHRGWPGRGHLVLFGLPLLEEWLWALLLPAATAPGWTVHLAFGEEGIALSEAALARRFPDKEALRTLYRTLGTLASPPDGRLPDVEHIARRLDKGQTGLMSPAGVGHGLAVFQQLGLVHSHRGAWRLVPHRGRKVDVTASERYNEGVRIREKFAAYSRIALAATPAALLALAAERSPWDEFAFLNPGSA